MRYYLLHHIHIASFLIESGAHENDTHHIKFHNWGLDGAGTLAWPPPDRVFSSIYTLSVVAPRLPRPLSAVPPPRAAAGVADTALTVGDGRQRPRVPAHDAS